MDPEESVNSSDGEELPDGCEVLPNSGGSVPSLEGNFEETGVTSKHMGSGMPTAELPQMEVLAKRKSVVSMLDQPMTDSAFIATNGASEREFGISLCRQRTRTKSYLEIRLKVVVDKTTTLQEGSFVLLRLSEPALLSGYSTSSKCSSLAQTKIEGIG